MPWFIRKRPNHNQYKVYGERPSLRKGLRAGFSQHERGNPLSKEWKTKAEAEKQLNAIRANYYRTVKQR